MSVHAEFGFSRHRDRFRGYPGLPAAAARPPRLESTLNLAPNKRVFEGSSSYVAATAEVHDPLGDARSEALADWFVAGYGPSRLLPATGKSPKLSDPVLDRLRPLFGETLIGTGFIDLLGEELGRAFAKTLQSVFVAGGLLPHVTALELRGRGGIRSAKHLVDAQRFEMDVLDHDGERIRVPATWLSQGYQSLVAWLADVVGQVLVEAGAPVDAADMEGLVLVDEIDLHLHPTWQVRLIPALKRVFPRLQFIATTHSPMVLPGLAPEEVLLLSQAPDGSVLATPSNQSPSLLTGSELLSTFFEIRKLYPEDLAEKLRRYGNLASDPTRSDAEDATLQRLKGELQAAGITFDWESVAREGEGCNREFKHDQFPLGHGTRLAPEQAPPGAELPLVVDPSDPAIDPSTEIVFRRERGQRNERWRPQGLTERGRKTIEVCGLDRPGLLDLYSEHVNHAVRPKVHHLLDVWRGADTRAIVETWGSVVRGVLAEGRPFRALAHDALDALVPASVRGEYKLHLPRPI